MKKKVLFLILIFTVFVMGCDINNNPTSKVEEFLGKYQMLDSNINTSYTQFVKDEQLDSNLRKRYENLIKKQYRNLSYEIKDEQIDGDTAIVTTEIKVINYKSAIQKYTKENYSNEEYHEKILEELENTKEKVTYTIDFIVKKDEKGNWKLEELDQIEQKKLLGMN